MSNSILEKISLVLADTRNVSETDRTTALKRLFDTELGLREQVHLLDYQALAYVHSQATENVRNISSQLKVSGRDLYQEPEYFRALCYTLAAYQYFRSKNMIPYLVDVKAERNR